MNTLAASWFAANRNKFSPQNQAVIQTKLNSMTDENALILSSVELKNPMLMLVIEFFLGWWGIHRFMLGETGMGLFMLLTGGFCGILWFVDIFTVCEKTKRYNFNAVLPYLVSAD